MYLLSKESQMDDQNKEVYESFIETTLPYRAIVFFLNTDEFAYEIKMAKKSI